MGVGVAWFGAGLNIPSPWEAGGITLGAHAVLLAAALFTTIIHFYMEPLRWRFSYLPGGTLVATAKQVRDALFCTALASYVLPFKLGIPLRIALLRREAGLGLHFIGVVIAFDGLISLSVWSAWAALCVWIAALHWKVPWYVWMVGITAVCALAAAPALHSRLRGRRADQSRAAIALLDAPGRRGMVAGAIAVVDVFSYGLRHAMLVWLATGNPDLIVIGGAIGVVATFTGIVSGLPMGLVGYDASLIALLAGAGVGLDQALAVALINRGLNLASAAILGVPAGARLGLGAGVAPILRKLRELSRGEN